ncbi:MAG: 1-acyl-sn-glycerol-3-phosphate acyltransferase, partial [Pseudomonadales bacterium]
MHEFDSIRPYRDDEVAGVVARLIQDPKLLHAASRLLMPWLAAVLPQFTQWLTRLVLARRTRSFRSVDDLQQFLVSHFTRFINETITELIVTGFDDLELNQGSLFISNHRDILMDTGLVNFVLYHAGLPTTEAAVGDNLLAEPYAADLMRLNKSFVIERSVTGKRAVYRSLTKTSHYIRHSLEAGNLV